MKQIWFCNELKVEREAVGRPGIYYFEKNLKIERDVTLTLERGSIIVLMKGAKIDMDDDATLEIAAPTREMDRHRDHGESFGYKEM